MDWSNRTSPRVIFTSAATTAPSESFTTSPGTTSVAGTVFHAPSRWTEAVSASRDFNAASVAWARLSWKSPSAALNTSRRAIIPASTYLPSANSTTMAASSIHGTGAQNLSKAMRIGCVLVSGIALGPDFASRRRASSVVKPPFEMTSGALAVAVDGHVCPTTSLDWFSAALTSGDNDVPGRDRLPWRALLVTGPCRCRRRRNIRGENGATVSLRDLDIDISFGREWDGGKKIFWRRRSQASGSELTAIHEGVDVALRQRFFQ